MLVSRVRAVLLALAALLPGTAPDANITLHPEPELEFPTSSTFVGIRDVLPIVTVIVEILNGHGFALYETDYAEGIVGGKRQIDANRSERILFRLSRGIGNDQSLHVEWLYGQFAVAFGQPGLQRIVVKELSETSSEVIKQVQLAVIRGLRPPQ